MAEVLRRDREKAATGEGEDYSRRPASYKGSLSM
jgi:hypothetical protein